MGEVEGGNSSWLRQVPDIFRIESGQMSHRSIGERSEEVFSTSHSIFEAIIKKKNSLGPRMPLYSTLSGS